MVLAKATVKTVTLRHTKENAVEMMLRSRSLEERYKLNRVSVSL